MADKLQDFGSPSVLVRDYGLSIQDSVAQRLTGQYVLGLLTLDELRVGLLMRAGSLDPRVKRTKAVHP